MISIDKILKRISLIRDNEQILKQKLDLNIIDYVADYNHYYSAERAFQLISQAMVDIGNHIIAKHKFGKPDNYGQVFSILINKEIIPDILGKKLIQFIGLRNILVHDYINLDREQFYEEVKEEINVINQFIDLINEFIT